MRDTEPHVIPLEEPEFGVQLNGRLVAVCPDRESADLVSAGLSTLAYLSEYRQVDQAGQVPELQR
jgi:hypothetical protein